MLSTFCCHSKAPLGCSDPKARDLGLVPKFLGIWGWRIIPVLWQSMSGIFWIRFALRVEGEKGWEADGEVKKTPTLPRGNSPQMPKLEEKKPISSFPCLPHLDPRASGTRSPCWRGTWNNCGGLSSLTSLLTLSHPAMTPRPSSSLPLAPGVWEMWETPPDPLRILRGLATPEQDLTCSFACPHHL